VKVTEWCVTEGNTVWMLSVFTVASLAVGTMVAVGANVLPLNRNGRMLVAFSVSFAAIIMFGLFIEGWCL
jgi:hypothetical protein